MSLESIHERNGISNLMKQMEYSAPLQSIFSVIYHCAILPLCLSTTDESSLLTQIVLAVKNVRLKFAEDGNISVTFNYAFP